MKGTNNTPGDNNTPSNNNITREIIFPKPDQVIHYKVMHDDDPVPEDIFVAIDGNDKERFVQPRHKIGSYIMDPYSAGEEIGHEVSLVTNVALSEDTDGTFYFHYSKLLVIGRN